MVVSEIVPNTRILFPVWMAEKSMVFHVRLSKRVSGAIFTVYVFVPLIMVRELSLIASTVPIMTRRSVVIFSVFNFLVRMMRS